MSENKDVSSTSKSLLPEDVIAILNEGMSESFKDGYLYIGNKSINDSMMPELCEWIVKLGDKVTILDLRDNHITSIGASMLLNILKTSILSLKELRLQYNEQIDDECMKSLGEYIKSNKSIEIMPLSYTNISDVGIEILAPYLDGNTTFKQLNLYNNKGITDKSIPLLMKMIESSRIEDININDTQITQKKIIYALLFCNIIKNGSTSLCLSRSVERNNMTSKGASVLFDTLKECSSIVSMLNLSHNQLDDECMKQLGEYLEDNEHVEELRLGFNKITDKGIEILSEYLIGNTTFKNLYLNSNKGTTNASAPHLIEMVKKSCITKLNVSFTTISDKNLQEIKKALSIPIDQREVLIKSNTKSAAKISAST